MVKELERLVDEQ